MKCAIINLIRSVLITLQYINKVFLTSGENITINGLEPSPKQLNSLLTSSTPEGISIEEHEPFNSKLWEKAKLLARQEEDLIEDIATLRRTVPSAATSGLKRDYKDMMEGDEAELRRRMEVLKEQEGKGAELELGPLERQADVETSWKNGVNGLGRLRRTMPEMVAKKERAERAEEYIRTSVK